MAGGLRASGPKADIALIVADDDAVVSGAFTQNVMCAAPVTYCKETLAKQSTCRAVGALPDPPLSHPLIEITTRCDVTIWEGWGGGPFTCKLTFAGPCSITIWVSTLLFHFCLFLYRASESCSCPTRFHWQAALPPVSELACFMWYEVRCQIWTSAQSGSLFCLCSGHHMDMSCSFVTMSRARSMWRSKKRLLQTNVENLEALILKISCTFIVSSQVWEETSSEALWKVELGKYGPQDMGFSLAQLEPAFLPQVLINAGQANAATGDKGYEDCHKSAAAVAEALKVSADDVLLLSTGVIGRPLKMEALLGSVPKLASNLGSTHEDAHHAAVAITTTDLVSKSAALEVSTARIPCITKVWN